jgi:hypothetical protein
MAALLHQVRRALNATKHEYKKLRESMLLNCIHSLHACSSALIENVQSECRDKERACQSNVSWINQNICFAVILE